MCLLLIKKLIFVCQSTLVEQVAPVSRAGSVLGGALDARAIHLLEIGLLHEVGVTKVMHLHAAHCHRRVDQVRCNLLMVLGAAAESVLAWTRLEILNS